MKLWFAAGLFGMRLMSVSESGCSLKASLEKSVKSAKLCANGAVGAVKRPAGPSRASAPHRAQLTAEEGCFYAKGESHSRNSDRKITSPTLQVGGLVVSGLQINKSDDKSLFSGEKQLGCWIKTALIIHDFSKYPILHSSHNFIHKPNLCHSITLNMWSLLPEQHQLGHYLNRTGNIHKFPKLLDVQHLSAEGDPVQKQDEWSCCSNVRTR